MTRFFVEAHRVKQPTLERTEYASWVPQDNRCLILYQNFFVDNNKNIDEERIKQAAEVASAEDTLTMLDVECFPTVINDWGNWPSDMDGLAKYLEVIRTFRKYAPDVRCGFYGVIPGYAYAGIMQGPKGERYKKWVDRFPNLQEIYKEVDVLFCDAYAFPYVPYRDEEWLASIAYQAMEVRNHFPEKKAYCVLSPYRFSTGLPSIMDAPLLDADLFDASVATANALYSGGVVLWGGVWNALTEDAQAQQPWYQIVQRYL